MLLHLTHDLEDTVNGVIVGRAAHGVNDLKRVRTRLFIWFLLFVLLFAYKMQIVTV